MADSKHTVGDLRQLQALPLRLKIPLTQQRIRDWYDHWDGRSTSVSAAARTARF